jgi:hypothetical protein
MAKGGGENESLNINVSVISGGAEEWRNEMTANQK